MSSLLKALKQQQSPLLKNKSVLDSSLIAQDRARTSRLWLIWPLALVLGGATGYATALWSGEPGADAKVAASDFSWGEAVSPPEVGWEATPTEPEPSQALTSSEVESQTQARQPTENQREALDLSNVSPELLNRFQDAVEQTGGRTESKVSVVPSLSDLSTAFQRQIPEFSYDSHMYRSSSSDRWIELNGQRLYEGDSYKSLNVIRIEPHQVVLALDSKAFSHPALEDWKR